MFENFKKHFQKVSWLTIVDDFIDLIKEFGMDEAISKDKLKRDYSFTKEDKYWQIRMYFAYKHGELTYPYCIKFGTSGHFALEEEDKKKYLCFKLDDVKTITEDGTYSVADWESTKEKFRKMAQRIHEEEETNKKYKKKFELLTLAVKGD
jgi:hypothetical protein